ncbi:MAG: Glycerate dehydrogenase [Rhodocyclaceae bacterium]|nr:MAG: D-2-hydroxyacid dehydrogenase [Rhodocyclaceae bacterium]MBE7421144.1 D-2-hydroxyacid dehydrogenase [Zoogloeaceae bacterium]MBV6408144.1 Glycerate dehydrogenase [Rhodocyclaceae bacterium]MCC6879700.1 D-2-hydroxyacid dehydrogenase [Rhodocyclaceae bacterium]CAG0933036.1 glycerate dehydrogenase [Rhodocyclaceae bacterium]
MNHRIVFLERDSIRGEFRRPGFPHDYDEYPLSAAEDVPARVREASIVITNKVVLRGELLATLPQLKMVACAATGTDNVDLAWCREHGIVVSNIRGYAANTVPEHAIAMAMALRRSLLAYRRDVLAGKWRRSSNFCFFDHPIRDLHGATLGVVGRGTLGEGVARLGEAFGMRVLWAERKGAAKVSPGRTAFEDVLRASDVISLHCPLNAETRGLIGEAELRLMKPDAILINTARGGLVDEAALVRALREGWIGGAGFDVLSKEPPREGNPLLELDLPNFILTPHVAWASAGAMQALLDQLTGNLEAFARGEPRNRVA